jgi:hypothetical protein
MNVWRRNVTYAPYPPFGNPRALCMTPRNPKTVSDRFRCGNQNSNPLVCGTSMSTGCVNLSLFFDRITNLVCVRDDQP